MDAVKIKEKKAAASEESRPASVEEYLALPEGTRAEYINGRLYMMASPSAVHQAIQSALNYYIESFIRGRNGDCQVYPTMDVRLKEEKNDYVQPDLFVVCDPDKMKEQYCSGAPDWVIEIVSPSNSRHDYLRKLDLYNNAGVREYWIVDPMQQRVAVYILEEEHFILNTYPFNEDIPVYIYPGALTINLSEFAD